jgi:hypothetical protein
MTRPRSPADLGGGKAVIIGDNKIQTAADLQRARPPREGARRALHQWLKMVHVGERHGVHHAAETDHVTGVIGKSAIRRR